MSNIKISLCLITYNQPESVARFLELLAQQATSAIELLIRDDSPNSKTQEVVDFYISKLSIPVRYFKGEKSLIGAYDKALLFLTEKAEGEYIWWFGDDAFARDAVSTVLSVLNRSENFALVLINSRDINNPLDKGLDLQGDQIFNFPGEMFRINVGLLGFPSATILRRELIAEKIKEAYKFVGTTLTGYYLVLAAITSIGAKSFYIQTPCLLSNPKPEGEARWYDSFAVHGINYTLISLDFVDKIDRISYRKGISDQYGRAWRAVIYERALGYQTGFAASRPKLAKMSSLYWTYSEFYIAFPLMLMPRPLLSIMWKIYKNLRNINN